MDLISEFENGYRYFGYWSSPQGYGNQYRCYNRNQVVKLLNTYNGSMNCGISMCTFKGEVPYLLYLPFDFDSDNLKSSLDDALKLYNELVEQGWKVSIQRSGYKGFHVLMKVVPKPYTSYQIRTVQQYYKDALDLKTCDTQIFGDIRRLIKIPGTCHAGKFRKTKAGWKRQGEGYYCKVLYAEDGDSLDLSKLVIDDSPVYDFDKTNGNGRKPVHEYPCLTYWLKEFRDEYGRREPPQLLRYSLVAFYLQMGLDLETIYKKLEHRYGPGTDAEWYDWDGHVTSKQLQQIASQGKYYPLKCKTIESMGFCLGDKCPFYNIKNQLRSVGDLSEDERMYIMWGKHHRERV